MVASVAESEVGACFKNVQSGAQLRVTLTELGHIQPPTPLRTDNSTAFGILNEAIKQKISKEMDMRCHWLTDRVRQKQFDVYWRPGRLGDYHTKHHAEQHHKDMSGLILHQEMLIPQVRPAHKCPNSPWETIHPPGGDNAECVYPHKFYTAEGNKSLTAT
jgi:hypothetical protein